MDAVIDVDQIALVDPSDFTTPYNLALAGAIEAQGRRVCMIGQAGGSLHRQGVQHGHFYPLLATAWGQRLPKGTARLVKGVCQGVDMLRLFRLLAAVEARIAHFQWSPLPTFDSCIVRRLRRRLPVVLTWHDSVPGNGSESWLMRQGYASLLRSFHAIIVHTRQAQQRAMAMGIDPAMVHRIPHGLLGDRGHLTLAKRRPRRDRLVLLQFGKIKPYKGIDLLLEALTSVPRDIRSRLDVRIVGKPYMDTAKMERYVQANDLAGCVTFRFECVCEAQEERLFADADAIILPYREIDASGVMMTAIARGVPVLATGIEGFRELFEDGGGAVLVPPNDAAALSRAIAEWVSAPEQLDALADGMLMRRARVPNWDEIARLHFAVYAEAHSRWTAARNHGKGSSRAGSRL
jgi:glycosyltransferase involved in cell wall biosynthesis